MRYPEQPAHQGESGSWPPSSRSPPGARQSVASWEEGQASRDMLPRSASPAVDTERRDANQERWRAAVGILEDRVCVRIATEAVATVLSGGSASLGGVRLDR